MGRSTRQTHYFLVRFHRATATSRAAMCLLLQFLCGYAALTNHKSTIEIVEASLVVLEPSKTNDPSPSRLKGTCRPVSIVVALPVEQGFHASKSVVIALEAECYPMRIDDFSMTDRELVHAVHPLFAGTLILSKFDRLAGPSPIAASRSYQLATSDMIFSNKIASGEKARRSWRG